MDSKNNFEKFKLLFNDLKLKTLSNFSKLSSSVHHTFLEGVHTLSYSAIACMHLVKVGIQLVSVWAHEALCKASVSMVLATPMVLHAKDTVVALAHQATNKTKHAYQMFTKHVHFNVQHFVMTSTAAVLVFALTFALTGMNRTQVQAAVLEAPKVETYNQDAMDVNYGDQSPIIAAAKDILKDKVSSAASLTPMTLRDGSKAYAYGNYIVDVQVPYIEGVDATIRIETLANYNNETSVETLTGNEKSVQEYNVKVNYVDTKAPVITLTASEVNIKDTETFDAKQYVASIEDNKDGAIAKYVVNGSIEQIDSEYLKPGTYTFTYEAKDNTGNTATKNIEVKVEDTKTAADAKKAEEEAEKEKAEQEEKAAAEEEAQRSQLESTNIPAGASGSVIASAALAQLGVTQDCTMLATNALAAAGIYFHDWPAGYLSLGTVVSASQAQPGDLIYYANGGAGVAHIAVYIGGGQAVHGGWQGSQTVIYSAYVGSGPVFIRVAQ